MYRPSQTPRLTLSSERIGAGREGRQPLKPEVRDLRPALRLTE